MNQYNRWNLLELRALWNPLAKFRLIEAWAQGYRFLACVYSWQYCSFATFRFYPFYCNESTSFPIIFVILVFHINFFLFLIFFDEYASVFFSFTNISVRLTSIIKVSERKKQVKERNFTSRFLLVRESYNKKLVVSVAVASKHWKMSYFQ